MKNNNGSLLRIDGLLSSIERYDDLIRQADVRLARMVKESLEAMLLKSVPGVGNYSALVISSMIGDIGRFNRALVNLDDPCESLFKK